MTTIEMPEPDEPIYDELVVEQKFDPLAPPADES